MGTVVFITGASSGFGKETAKRLSVNGFKVYGTSRKEIRDPSISWSMLKMDVRKPLSIKEAVSHVLEREGRIDILINNAGLGAYTPLEEVPMQDLDELMDTNFRGPLLMCQAILPTMRTQGSGLIINVSSIAGLIGLPFMGTYSASKFALEGLMEALSMEVRPFGITVSIVEPGDFNTEIIQNQKITQLPDDSPYLKAIRKMKQSSDQNMANAPGPQDVADKILKIINTENPRLRYRVGNTLEKASIVLKALLPSRLFEKIFMRVYRIDGD